MLYEVSLALVFTEIYCCKAKNTAYITLHSDINYLSLCLVKYSAHRKMFLIKMADLNEVHILCYVHIFIIALSFLKKLTVSVCLLQITVYI